jgi:hypothetical protein
MPYNGLRPGEVADSESGISRLVRTSYEKSFSGKTNHSNLAWVLLCDVLKKNFYFIL